MIIIIGAGIAGLTAAYRLKQAGQAVKVIEQSGEAGGCLRTVKKDGFLLELGPNTFLNSSKALWELANSLGLGGERVESSTGGRRYIFKDEKLHLVPAGPRILFSPLLSLKGRLRLLREPFIRPSFKPDESLADFTTRRLGKEALDTLVTPFVSGIYAGDPCKLSIRAVFPKLAEIEAKHGSLIRGMGSLKGGIRTAGMGSFKNGIGDLANALKERLKENFVNNARVVSLERLNGKFIVEYERDGTRIRELSDSAVVATPAYSAASILSGLSDELSSTLSGIEYAPIAVIHTGFKRSDVPVSLDGFGFLVPRKQLMRMLGSLFSSSLFSGRAPKGHVLLTSFVGGQLDREAIDLTGEDTVRTIRNDLLKALGIKAPPIFACVTRYSHAIAQYNIGHIKKIERVSAIIDNFKGLHLTGSYFTGISVADTIEHAEATARKILNGGAHGS